MCYAAIALVTDRDAGVVGEEGVSQTEVFAAFERGLGSLRDLLATVLAALPAEQTGCACASALDGLQPPFELP
jgi:5'-methylthioadenosine phosphorylase